MAANFLIDESSLAGSTVASTRQCRSVLYQPIQLRNQSPVSTVPAFSVQRPISGNSCYEY